VTACVAVHLFTLRPKLQHFTGYYDTAPQALPHTSTMAARAFGLEL